MKLDKQTLAQNIGTDLQDNSTGQISPSDVRTNLLNIIDSIWGETFTSGVNVNFANIGTHATRTTKIGELALSKLGHPSYTSVDNTAVGYSALAQNYNGYSNTAIGSHALGCSVYGFGNTALGHNALAGNIEGDRNIGIGSHTLQRNKGGNYNIAVGHGAGYYIGENTSHKLYIGVHDVDSDSLCGEGIEAGTDPTIFGELDTKRIGIGVQSLHDYGTLQVSGAVSPARSGAYALGHTAMPWSNVYVEHSIDSNQDQFRINDDIYFSGGKVGFNTPSPSGQGLITVSGSIVPAQSKEWSLGHEDLQWKSGYFENLTVSGVASINTYTYKEMSSCLYECRTLYLATSGICDGGTGEPCGYLGDESLEGAGLIIPSSGSDYRRDYKWLYAAPDSTLDCLEVDNSFARSSWQSNISIDIASGCHVRSNRILGREQLSMVTAKNCYGLFIRKNDATVSTGSTTRNEIQHLKVVANGGTFTLSFGGQTTSPIAHNASAATIKSALEALSTVGAGNIEVKAGSATLPEGTYSI